LQKIKRFFRAALLLLAISRHVHQTISKHQARALVTHELLQIDFCECGCFRLAGSERWTRPLDPELTRAEAARYLNVSPMTVTRPAKRPHGKQVAGWHGRREWRYTTKQLDRLRFGAHGNPHPESVVFAPGHRTPRCPGRRTRAGGAASNQHLAFRESSEMERICGSRGIGGSSTQSFNMGLENEMIVVASLPVSNDGPPIAGSSRQSRQ
jgi:hypothetical protein